MILAEILHELTNHAVPEDQQAAVHAKIDTLEEAPAEAPEVAPAEAPEVAPAEGDPAPFGTESAPGASDGAE